MSQKHILILGGGTAGWMAANLFAKKWPTEKVKITLVESPDVDIIGVGEGSTPSLKHFFESIDVQEKDWMPKCNATYKVNIRFDDWSPKSGVTSYRHPFTSQVDVFTARAFMVNTRTRRLGLDTHVNPESFLLNGQLAKTGKGPLTPANFPFITEYGYHFDSHLLGKYLSDLAVSRGVNYQQAHIEEVVLNEHGDIECLRTRENSAINADFFIDCTGFVSLLMQKTLKVPFKAFKENLFNDSAVVMPTKIDAEIPVETVSTALSAGWCWKIPLTNRYGNGYVYSADFISRDEAENEFRQHLGMLNSDEDVRHLKMRVGQLEKHWSKNCMAIGLSQGFIEPLEATALHLVQIAIDTFANYYEKGQFSNQYQSNFNHEISNRFEKVRDYIVAHYKMNTRDDSDYWIANRENKHLSDSLMRILNVWFKGEDLHAEIERQRLDSHFDAVSWHCLLAGYGAFPKLVAQQPGQGDLYQEQNIAKFIEGCSLNYKSHAECLYQ